MTQLAFETQPGTTEGRVVLEPIRVALQDAGGRTVTSSKLDVTIRLATSGAEAVLSGTTTVRAVDGVATFADLSVAQPGSTFALEADAAGLPVVRSHSFAVRLTFTEVSAGWAHTCGLTIPGFLYCWGTNSSGEIGDGTFTNRTSPTPVASPQTFVRVSAAIAHTCAVTASHAALCWGSGTTRPTPVETSAQFSDISTGEHHDCGVAVTGVIHCWGRNSSGALGDGTTLSHGLPAPVALDSPFVQVSAASEHTCGLSPGHVAYCWGDNAYGQLGNGTTHTSQLVPMPVVGALRFVQLSVGPFQTCGVGVDARAYCWGFGLRGELGTGSGGYAVVPTPVVGNFTVTQVSVGAGHSCAVSSDAGAYCWGGGSSGEIGNDGTVDALLPSAVAGSLPFARLSAGASHTCGVTTGGVAFCWGANLLGQLGDGTNTDRRVPTPVVQ